MIQDILSGLVVAVISGSVGFWLNKSFFTVEKYLPSLKRFDSGSAYTFIEKEWYLYHFTYDPEVDNDNGIVLAKSALHLTLEKNLIISGAEEVKVDHRRALTYSVRGQINSGCLYLTGISNEDPSDSYTMIFPNLLDEKMLGLVTGRDYARNLFSSPAFLSPQELNETEATGALVKSNAQYYSKING